MKLNELRTDRVKEVEGVWEDYGADMQVKIARVNNPKYRNYLRKETRPFVRRMGLGNKEVEQVEKIQMRAVAKFILLDWKNLEDDQGKPIPYSSEKALEMFKEFPDFYEDIVRMAGDRELFKAQEQVESVKNLDDASSGS